MSSMAIKEAYLELVPAFEKQSGHKVVTRFVGSGDLMKRLRAGETTDLVIMAAGTIDELAKEGKIVPGSRVDLVKSIIGVAGRAGGPEPGLSSGGGRKGALVAAQSIRGLRGASG